jgi:peptidoglycan/xylan/chitin deacetylase (PgdA/CDA1 family)
MRVRGLGRARRVLRAARNLLSPHGVILVYHRIARAEHDPWSLCVSPDRFAEQLEVLRRCATVVPLQRLFEAIPAARRNRPPVAITFDDGYADNLHRAKPLLERHGTPATLFVASGYMGVRRAFWSDELVRIVLGAATLPHHLALTIDGAPFEWTIGAPGRHDAVADRAEPTNGDHLMAERRTLLLDLWQRLRPLSSQEQVRLLEELTQWAGCREPLDADALPLSREELARLAADGLIEIGAHTVSHCELPAHSIAQQMREIAESKIDCEVMIDRPVTSFAYPYGKFDATSMDCVRQSGFTLACTTRPGLNLAGTDRFRLLRLGVRDWDGDEFERRFRRRFDPPAYGA